MSAPETLKPTAARPLHFEHFRDYALPGEAPHGLRLRVRDLGFRVQP